MKKILLIAVLIAAMLLCACGGGKDDPKTTTTTAQKVIPAVSVIGNDAAEKRECKEEPILSSADDLSDELGIEPEMYSEFYYSTAGDFSSAETIAVFNAAEGKAKDIESALKTKLQSLVSQNKNYNEKNYDMAIKGVVKTVGDKYVYFVVSPNVDEIVKAIENNF